jgi:hypothetical protein
MQYFLLKSLYIYIYIYIYIYTCTYTYTLFHWFRADGMFQSIFFHTGVKSDEKTVLSLCILVSLYSISSDYIR